MQKRYVTHRVGIALPMVMLSAFIVLGIILGGLSMASDNVLFVAGVHRRNVAQAASEGGIYKAISMLEMDPHYNGTFTEKLGEADIEVTVDNVLSGNPPHAVIRSTAMVGRIHKKLEVRIEPSALSFQAVGAQGQIAARGPNYANGVHGLHNPIPEPISVHSNYQNSDDSISTTAAEDRFIVKGDASAAGTINPAISSLSKHENQPTKTFVHLNKSTLLNGTFQTGTVPSNGTVSGRLRVTGDLNMATPLVLEEGSTLHVTGDAKLDKGVVGKGTLVVDGDLYARASANLDMNNDKGLVIYSDKNVNLVHPSAEGTGGGNYNYTVEEVGDFFAQMPDSAPYFLSETLPVGAPNGVDFFNWYKEESESPSDAFLLWRNGDESDLNPGLPADVKGWLDSSMTINNQLNDWAQNG